MSRQGPPVGLIIIVVAVTAAGLLLWMLVRSGDEEGGAPASTPQARGTSGDRVAEGTPDTARPFGGGDRVERPRLPDQPGQPGQPDQPGQPGRPEASDSTRPRSVQVTDFEQGRRGRTDRPPPTETIINGVRVRDHRQDRSKPISLPTTRPPPRGRRIAPELTGELTSRIMPIVRECAMAHLAPETRGPKPRAEGQVVVTIKDQQARITRTVVELSDVTGGTVDQARKCIEDKTVGVTAPAANETDLEDYPIQISYAIPSR
jgi:hypothetical protein